MGRDDAWMNRPQRWRPARELLLHLESSGTYDAWLTPRNVGHGRCSHRWCGPAITVQQLQARAVAA